MNDSLQQILENFTFIRPLWLWAILGLVIVYALKLKFGQQQNLWQQILPSHLYQKLIISKGFGKPSRFIHSAMLSCLLCIIAMSGPSWEKLPQAVYQTQSGKVILLDMSMSMRATDLSPDRLTRARFKAIDLINQLNEGETGLIAYSANAFVISPLTDDAATLANLIPSLSPEIMPTQGSAPLEGLQRASELLSNAGYKVGDIYWLTDGINYDDIKDVRSFIQNSPFEVSALLVGTEEGAPIKLSDGKLLKDFTGSIVIPSVNAYHFNSAMSGTSANFSMFTSDNSDITQIKRKIDLQQQQQAKQVENSTGDVFKDMGPFLVLLVLPIAAYGFRKGIMSFATVGLLSAGILGSSLLFPSMPAMAQNTVPTLPHSNVATKVQQPTNQVAHTESSANSLLNKVFKNADQRGKIAFDEGAYDQANELFTDQAWQAASAYKKGDFERAANLYKQLAGTVNTYNQANALAKAMQLEDALNAYNQVLEQQPGHVNASKNKAIVEQLLKQQEQQEQQDQQNKQDQNSDKQQQSDDNSDDKNGTDKSDTDQNTESEQQDPQNKQDENKPSEDEGEPSDEASDEASENSDQENSQQANDRDLNNAAEQEQAPQEQADEQEAQAAGEQVQNNEAINQEDQRQAISNADLNMDDLTPEEKEEMQRMQMILNKIPDDPAYLLQRKMLLEAHRRKNTPAPPTQENW